MTDKSKTPIFPQYPGRGRALSELHARPTPQIPGHSTTLHYAFMSEGGSSVNLAILSGLARQAGMEPPKSGAGYFRMEFAGGNLSWEKHSEFSTYLWTGDAPTKPNGRPSPDPFSEDFGKPGQLISAVRVNVLPFENTASEASILSLLGPLAEDSLCAMEVSNGKAVIVTDYRQNDFGETVFHVFERELSASEIGGLVKAIIELETYRTLALLGLPLAQSLSGEISAIEVELSRITEDMRGTKAETSREMLEKISELAAELEAGAVASLFRFGASRAYGEIVEERLDQLQGTPWSGSRDLSVFLRRRLGPALRTCRSVEERQANLSRKLTRAANLLRTRIEVEIEEQNRNLLASMNRRADLQLRLQQTVEGLSVAAVSYYVVGLFYYLAQALGSHLPESWNPKVMTGMFVPVAIFGVWWLVRRIRKRHSEE